MRLAHTLLLIIVLLGQVALVQHEYDFASHQSGDACEVCLHATPLSHATLASHLTFDFLRTIVDSLPYQIFIDSISWIYFLARGPPVLA